MVAFAFETILVTIKSTIMSKNLKTNIVTRAQAKEWFANWMEFATKTLKFSAKKAPKSILIPLIDIENIIQVFKSDKRELSGIRIYFTKKRSYDERPDDLALSCIVVPTVHGASGKRDDHDDAIIPIPPFQNLKKGSAAKKSTAVAASGELETIYDMTYPNPPYNDGTETWV